jgi:hypothetical protein
MRTNLMLISTTNLTGRTQSERRRGRLRKSTEDVICAHLLLWKRFQYGSEPTPDEVADAQFRERMRLLEASPKVPARHVPNSIIFGFGGLV